MILLTKGNFLDLRRAFDSVNHSILLHKLNQYDTRGVANDWFRSYLSKREKFVCANAVNGYSSTSVPVTCGVPQGFVCS